MRYCKNEFRLDVSVNSYNMIQLIKRPLHNCSQLLWSLPVIKTCWRNSRTISLIEEMVVTAFLSSCKRLQVLDLPPGVGRFMLSSLFFHFLPDGWFCCELYEWIRAIILYLAMMVWLVTIVSKSLSAPGSAKVLQQSSSLPTVSDQTTLNNVELDFFFFFVADFIKLMSYSWCIYFNKRRILGVSILPFQ